MDNQENISKNPEAQEVYDAFKKRTLLLIRDSKSFGNSEVEREIRENVRVIASLDVF